MTDLTEQWKRGEFVICNAGKCQYYYVQNEKQQEVIKTEYCLFDDNTPNWQILAPVPSYEEWKAADNCMLENEVLRLKNAQLKEQIERLEKQLNIAIGVLSQYAEAPTRNLARCALDRIAEIDGDYSHYWEQQIKELNK